MFLFSLVLATVVNAGDRGEVIRNEKLWAEMEAGKYLLTPQPHTYLNAAEMPRDFTWANVNGTDYLTTLRNQHIPVYCGSCWAHGPTSAMADRWNIISGPSKLPQELLSVQAVLSCGNDKTQCGTCNGGDDGPVYQYAKEVGIPGESCSNYMAVNTECREHFPVTDKNKPACYTCSPGAAGCKAVTEYKTMKVSEFGTCSGYEKMKAEIYARGPISCGIDATSKMESYTGGIYSEKGADSIDHIISIVGWGIDRRTLDEYWVVRNSWGNFWGEDGYMRIVTSRNTGPAGTGNNQVETECGFGVVSSFD